jgi:hypothetical protein
VNRQRASLKFLRSARRLWTPRVLSVPAQWKHWKRPNHFKASMIGQTIGPMPYWWGGDDTPQSFLRRIADGALAGSVCTCRDARYNQCVVSQAAGVDCSGFVSRAWGIAKLGTAGLLDVATPVAGFNNLRPGDAFDWPGHHVRLLVGRELGAAIAFKVLESATRADLRRSLRAHLPCKRNESVQTDPIPRHRRRLRVRQHPARPDCRFFHEQV